MTDSEDAAIIERFKQIEQRYGRKTVYDVKSKKMIYVPQEILDLEDAARKKRETVADPS